jgi:hypothetical protein
LYLVIFSKIISFIILFSNIFSQSNITSNLQALPINKLSQNFYYFINSSTLTRKKLNLRKSYWKISYNTEFAFNNGHPNIDNYGDFSATGSFNSLISTRFEFQNKFIFIEVEPYIIKQENLFDNNDGTWGTWRLTNNYYDTNEKSKVTSNIKQSQIVIHYNGFGIGLGKTNHWWSPGFHSAIVLSSNANSQKSYSLGTFRDIKMGKFSFGSKLLVLPYKSSVGTDLFFSGLKAKLTYHSNPNITLGFYRAYSSGDFSNLSETTTNQSSWTYIDAAKLVIEPLFGQSKKGLSYTIPGTPGFDAWDEVLSGYINLHFPDQYLDIYAEVASDDNRGNMTDLLAHWDHTLGYTLGFKKYSKLNKRLNIFIGAEYLSTKISNTYNPKFYRGGANSPNFYTKSTYDYFTYNGRRLGAHSGTSSDDFILILGFGDYKSLAFFSLNKERHGIKSMGYPELKTELNFTYNRKTSKNQSVFFTFEYEKIKNFGFIQSNISISKLIWIGYSFHIN